VLYVGASEPSAAAVEEVNRFCAALPGGFGIRVINVRSESDRDALDARLTTSSVSAREIPHPPRLTRRQRVERGARRMDAAEALTDIVAR
jgi:hypothetical protein